MVAIHCKPSDRTVVVHNNFGLSGSELLEEEGAIVDIYCNSTNFNDDLFLTNLMNETVSLNQETLRQKFVSESSLAIPTLNVCNHSMSSLTDSEL